MAALPEVAEQELPADQRPKADDGAVVDLARELANCGCLVFFAPRGVGRTIWNQDTKKQTQILRRFMLLGQTLDGVQAWDVRRAIQAIRSLGATAGLSGSAAGDAPLTLCARGTLAGVALYASLFEPNIDALLLEELPPNHRQGPMAMAAERSRVKLLKTDTAAWGYPQAVAKQLGWKPGQLEIVGP